MKTITGYLVTTQEGEIIAATGNFREAMYIAREWKSFVVKVETTIAPGEDAVAKHTVVYDGTI